MDEEHNELEDLVARAQSGEAAAFEELYDRHQAGIYTFLRSQVRDPELAADLTQDTFVRAWESLPRLRKAGAFLGWLHRIAVNLVRDQAKSGRARLETVEGAPENGEDGRIASQPGAEQDRPEERALSGEMRDEIWRALEMLSAEQRMVTVMHHMESMSVDEIARALGVRPGTVMSRLARARAALREQLSQYVEGTDERM